MNIENYAKENNLTQVHGVVYFGQELIDAQVCDGFSMSFLMGLADRIGDSIVSTSIIGMHQAVLLSLLEEYEAKLCTETASFHSGNVKENLARWVEFLSSKEYRLFEFFYALQYLARNFDFEISFVHVGDETLYVVHTSEGLKS